MQLSIYSAPKIVWLVTEVSCGKQQVQVCMVTWCFLSADLSFVFAIHNRIQNMYIFKQLLAMEVVLKQIILILFGYSISIVCEWFFNNSHFSMQATF